MSYFNLTIWWNSAQPVPHGYTPGDEENTLTLRLGPLVFGWEMVEHS